MLVRGGAKLCDKTAIANVTPVIDDCAGIGQAAILTAM
jgi:hypothetical protein